MQWALIATQQMQIPDPNWDGNSVRQNITIEAGTIANLITYNGTDSYTPPEGTKLESVPDTAKVGDAGY